MPNPVNPYLKRDVLLIVDHLGGAIKAIENLRKLQNSRELEMALVASECAQMWLEKYEKKVPERQ